VSSGREKTAQNVLWTLANEKQALERELNSARKTFIERDTSSSKVMVSAVVHTVGLLKSQVPDMDLELLRGDYQCKSDAERDALMDGAYDVTQHFVSSFDFSVIGDQSYSDRQS
jgi:hypothetical protein